MCTRCTTLDSTCDNCFVIGIKCRLRSDDFEETVSLHDYTVVMLYYFHQTGSLHSHASSVLLVGLLSCHEGRTIYFIGRVLPSLPPSSRLFAWYAASGCPRQADKNQGHGKRWDKRYELPTSDYIALGR